MSNQKSEIKNRKGWVQQWASYKRMISYARPYMVRLIVGGVCGVIFAGSTTGLLVALRDILRNALHNAPWETVILIALCLPILAAGRGVGQFLSEYFMQWVGNKVVMDMRVATFAHLQELSMRYFSKSKTGELISRTINDSMMIERAVSVVLGDLVKEPFVMLGAVGYLFWLDPKLAFASLVLFPICIIPIAIFGRRVRHYAKHGQERLAALVSIMQEALMGIRIVKAFGMERYEVARFTEQCQLFFNRIMRVTRDKASIEPLIVFISAVGLVLVLLYARWTHMPVEDLLTFAAAMVLLYEPVKKLSKIHLHIQQTSASADRIFEILDTPVAIEDAPGALNLGDRIENLRFDNVQFAYDAQPVLCDVAFTIAAGERVAIVGGSGAGKTTLVNLIPRFYDVTGGGLLINGTDIRRFTLKSLRAQIGIVTQETNLFNDTVAANIAYGHTEASVAIIEQAARRAYAHEFILQMPEGYNTVIGERGVRLSGGQCQRLAIARAILRNPPILILDEATSALDTESERLVQAALDDLMEGRTVFAIAHRLSTVIHCDRIIVLDEGRIVESGKHQELLDRNGM
ncbi:MAG: ABC transporter transmembrane domain-containing protein, partial [Kiritimatiellota bacterium]|nr:ABC transporter transmembrane domain-containing protein [Kiritimatiellota bacterium]